MLDPDIPEDHKIFLRQSYRVPRAVHAVSERFIRQVSRQQDKVYLPRRVDGAVHRLSWDGYRSPEYGILKSAERHLADGKNIMFLASCSYMLWGITAVLRKNGIPFHNPYRKGNGFWNPLRMRSRHPAANRILALLAPHPDFGVGRRQWTIAHVRLFSEWFRPSGVLQAGARESLGTLPRSADASLEDLFLPDALASLMVALEGTVGDLLSWYRDRVAPDPISVRYRVRARSGCLAEDSQSCGWDHPPREGRPS
jgi:hypothetical protein